MNGITAAAQGRLPRDAAELRYTPQGTAFISFSIAVHDDKRADADPTEWLRVTAWGDRAEQLDGSLTKGREVYVEGRLRMKPWKTSEGIDRPSLELSAWTVQLLGALGRSAPKRRGPQSLPVALGAGHRVGGPSAALGVNSGRDTRRTLGLDDDTEAW